jgi:hypothetical protein
MQKYVGAVVDVCGSGDDTNFFPQFGESRYILIRTFYKERIMLAHLYILSSKICLYTLYA